MCHVLNVLTREGMEITLGFHRSDYATYYIKCVYLNTYKITHCIAKIGVKLMYASYDIDLP